jgi:hypothetical protein
MNPTPEFMAAIDRHQAMRATLGLDHPLTQRALTLVMELAPDKLKTLMADRAALGLDTVLIDPALIHRRQ